MEGMSEFPDDHFDLAIVDPPYGIGKDGQKKTICKNPKHNRKHHTQKSWDSKCPDQSYFDELFRVSRDQIIWGANYYPQHLFGSMGWIFWDKGQDLNQSDGELAFTSFDRALRRKVMNRGVLNSEGTIHPTQKPVKLYKWILKNYAESGQRILDTHLGSMSIAIACHDYKCNLTGFEIDPDYYEKGCERVQNHVNQLQLFR